MSLFTAIYAYFLHPILSLLVLVILVNVVLSWLVAFDVVNRRNRFVQIVGQFTHSVTAPLIAPFRRFIPPLGGLDLAPLALLLTIFFVRDWALPQLLLAVG
jgi:YggT family protein